MNWNQIDGNWKQFKGQAKKRWGDLTDDELDVIDGNRLQLEGRIQERYVKLSLRVDRLDQFQTPAVDQFIGRVTMKDAPNQGLIRNPQPLSFSLYRGQYGSVQSNRDGHLHRVFIDLDPSRSLPQFPEIIFLLHVAASRSSLPAALKSSG